MSSYTACAVFFLSRNSDRNSPVTMLVRVDWVSQWLWDHPIETDHQPSYKGVSCVSYLPPMQVNICRFPQCRPSFCMCLLPLSSSPLLLTLTVRDPPPNGQLNALILVEVAWWRITYQYWQGYLSVNGGSLAFAGIWGPRWQEYFTSFVC